MHPNRKKHLDAVDTLLFGAIEKAFSISDQKDATLFIRNFAANLKSEKLTLSKDEFIMPSSIKQAYKIALDRTINSDLDVTGVAGENLAKFLSLLLNRIDI